MGSAAQRLARESGTARGLVHRELTFPCLSTTGRSPVMSTTVEGSASLAPPSTMKSTPWPRSRACNVHHITVLHSAGMYSTSACSTRTFSTGINSAGTYTTDAYRTGVQCSAVHSGRNRRWRVGNGPTSDPSAEVNVLPTTVGSTSQPASAPSRVALVHSRGRSSSPSSACTRPTPRHVVTVSRVQYAIAHIVTGAHAYPRCKHVSTLGCAGPATPAKRPRPSTR